MTEWEICNLEEVTLVKEEYSRFRKRPGIRRWEARIITPSGMESLQKSNEYEEDSFYQRPETSNLEKAIRAGELRVLEYRRILSLMASMGWEPASSDPAGRVVLMKRQINATKTEKSSSPTDLLRQLANLRDEGILKEQEYQTKKVEILKRM